jgi:hypothetical protein
MTIRLLVCLLLCSAVVAQSQSHTVLVDIFTNSHCGPCAAMHAAVEASISTTSRASRTVIVYNHIATYSDDAIYQANKDEPLLRAKWYGFSSGTPTMFFDGQKQTSGYGAWNAALDGLMEQPSAYVIEPNLTAPADSLVLEFWIRRTPGTSSTSVSAYAVLVEDVLYTGRNGVPEHNGALRALFTPVEGNLLSFDANNEARGRIALRRNDDLWNVDKLRAVVSVQDPNTKRSLEAIQVPVSTITEVQERGDDPEQPFDAELVSISGAVLVNRQFSGVAVADVQRQFLNEYPSGVYYLRIRRGSAVTVQPILYTR